MSDEEARPYRIDGREVIAKTGELRVSILTLGPGQCVPWHHHSQVADSFVCMEGPMEIRTRAPDSRVVLQPGEFHRVPSNTAHRVAGVDGGACRFTIVQGVGRYDYVADPEE